MRQLLLSFALVTLATAAQAQFTPEKLTPMGEKIEAAMKSDIRTAEEKDRDAERKPRQTLEFFGLQDNMRVVELVPAGGWYTKILGPVLAEKGELYVAIGTTPARARAEGDAFTVEGQGCPDRREDGARAGQDGPVRPR